MMSESDVRDAMRITLGRIPGDEEVSALVAYAASGGLGDAQIVNVLASTSEFVQRDLGAAMANHLFSLHRARVALMATALPAARRILDLGGAYAPLCDSGYPHAFEELIIVDLPPADRHDEFAGRIVTDRLSPLGPVRVAYSSMIDLSIIADDSIDLVWSGQSIEHITVVQARTMYREILRVLRPDGWFCLDTPNRLMTRIHAEGGFIHPDHKHEYEPAELVQELQVGGFDVVRSLGVCDMPYTFRQGSIDYRDFVVGAGLSLSLDTSYVQFHACQPTPRRA
jgi:SAM-dependent methyltransferase